jgi:8-oxo-dGTP pyrophosphatase MutT (NUDIX family)
MMGCNNCGNLAHGYKYCKHPITSNGVIHVTRDGKYLMICRRKTLGYVDFMRGRYNAHTPAYIMNLINEMTVDEKAALLAQEFSELSADLWGTSHEDAFSREKFELLKRGAVPQSLAALVAASDTAWESQEWGFPKGRRNANETEVACALREYEEETGHSRHHLKLIKNLLPFEEIFTGSNYKSYKHKYYVGFCDAEPTGPFQASEVSAMRCFTYEEALAVIRPYNTERKQILAHVHTLLTTHFFDHFMGSNFGRKETFQKLR